MKKKTLTLLFLSTLGFSQSLDSYFEILKQNNPTLKSLKNNIYIDKQKTKLSSTWQNPNLSLGANDLLLDNFSKRDIEPFSYEMDKESAKRLLSNLISNAIKYTQIGGFIEITLKNKTLKVKDNGIGIEEQKIKSIFDRYYRATKVDGGFGIGLSMVSDICKRYNLLLDVSSKAGKGSEFVVGF